MDEKVFFAQLRKTGLFRTLNQSQVSGIQRIISAWEVYGYGLDTGLAYILATPYHETGRRMQPVREGYGKSTADTIKKLDAAWAKGSMKWVKKNYWRDGWFGRGDVQITHESNYSGPLRDLVLKLFGVDIHKDPDQMLKGPISAYAMIEGMTKGFSTKSEFSAKPLEFFINSTKTDYNGARATVNPAEKDSYKPIGDIARKFEVAIRAAREAAGEPFKGEGFPVVPPRMGALVAAKPEPRMPRAEPMPTFRERSDAQNSTRDSQIGGPRPSAVVTNVSKTDDAVVIETAAEVPGADAIEVPVPAKATTKEIRAGIYDGKYHKDLQVVQVMLQAKGYFLLGDANGIWDSKTAAAVLAFRREHDMDLIDEVDDAFIVRLVKADKRSTGREDSDVGEIRGRAPVEDAFSIQKFGKWIMGLGLFGTAGSTTIDLQQTNESLLSLHTLAVSAKAAAPFLIVCVVGVGLYFLGRRLVKRYFGDWKEGRIA